jgi:phosphatidate cytidylyltransferase
MASGELAKRVAVAAVGIPLAVVLLHRGGWVLGVVLAAIAAGGALEFYALAAARGVRAFRYVGAALAGALVLLAVAYEVPAAAAACQSAAVLTTVLAVGIASLRLRGVDGSPLAACAITVFGAVFVGATLAFAVFLRNLSPVVANETNAAWAGASLVAYPLAIVWVGDTLAYFCGRRWGRHKLSPISPKKSVEGAVAGFVGSVAAGALVGWLVFDLWLGVPIGVGVAALGGALIAPIAQAGDLAESLFKREAGVKDSGNILPGHGGVLDRFDALFYALPVAWVYLALIVPRLQDSPWR